MGILKEGREWKQIWWYSLSSPGQGMPGCSGMLGNTVVDRKDKRKPIVSICCFSSPVTKQMCEQTKRPTPNAIEMMNTMNVHDLKKNCRPRITFTEQLKWWRMEWVCQGYYSFSIFISFYFDLVFQFVFYFSLVMCALLCAQEPKQWKHSNSAGSTQQILSWTEKHNSLAASPVPAWSFLKFQDGCCISQRRTADRLISKTGCCCHVSFYRVQLKRKQFVW